MLLYSAKDEAWATCGSEIATNPYAWRKETARCNLTKHSKKVPHMRIENGLVMAVWDDRDVITSYSIHYTKLYDANVSANRVPA